MRFRSLAGLDLLASRIAFTGRLGAETQMPHPPDQVRTIDVSATEALSICRLRGLNASDVTGVMISG